MDEVIIQYLTGSANEQERLEVLAWLNQSEENRRYFDQLKDVYQAAIVNKSMDQFDAEIAWQKVSLEHYKRKSQNNSGKMVSMGRKTTLTYLLSIASVFILAFFLGGGISKYFFHFENKASEIFSEVIAPYGSRVTLTLPDSSQVWLNAGSKLRYSSNFLQKTRDVYLFGEGYFEVKKMSHKMFVVHTTHLNVKVYGTAFNVKAYTEERTIETTLVRGSVAIEGSDTANYDFKPVFLKPNQKARFIKSTSNLAVVDRNTRNSTIPPRSEEKNDLLVVTPKVDPVLYTSWKDNRWVIQGEELQNLAVKLERRYDVKISFEAESLKNYKFSGILTDETLEQVLNIIKISAPIDYSIENKKVVLKSNKYFKKRYDELLMKH